MLVYYCVMHTVKINFTLSVSGLPNALGGYDESPAIMASHLKASHNRGVLNMYIASICFCIS